MYKLTKNGVIRLADNLFIPNTPANRHWQEYQEWLRQGNQPEPEFTFDDLKQQLRQKIHQIRKEKENSGINVSTTQGTFIVDTSQIGRSNLQGTILTYEIGILNKTSDSVPWKFENGFLDLTYDQLKEIASFVTDYIEKLFLAEKQHYEAIEGLSTEEELQKYDTNQYWPLNNYSASF